MKIWVSSVVCPVCGAEENHPRYPDMILIRGFKVCDETGHWWSQCLVCAGYYDKALEPVTGLYDPEKGWF